MARGDQPDSRVCERCASRRISLVVFPCGVLMCSTCLLQGYQSQGERVIDRCLQCQVEHRSLGLLLVSTGRIRHWFEEARFVRLLMDLMAVGYFWVKALLLP